MNKQSIFILFLAFIGCHSIVDKELEKAKVEVNSSIKKSEIKSKSDINNGLNSLLQNPINLKEFKKSKDINYTTTSVTNGMDYHFHPDYKDSIFYVYNYPDIKIDDIKRMDKVVVFKHGENKNIYDDENEILIELRIFNVDPNLGKANLVGLTKSELEKKFGNNYLTKDDKIVYSFKNNVLILTIENSVVNCYRFLRLSTDKIDLDLIEKIT